MRIKLLQWNVWYKELPNKIAAEVKRLGVDIVAAQELMQDIRGEKQIDTANEIAQLLGFSYFYQQADTWDNREDKTSQGNAIFSRWPISLKRSSYVQDLKHNPVNAWSEGRVYVEVQIKLLHTQLAVGTTHLSYFDHFGMTEERKIEVDKLVKAIGLDRKKLVVTGDLNSVPGDYAVKSMEKILNHAGPDYKSPTWTTKPFDYQGFKEDKLAWRLDYVFATPDVRVIGAELVQTDVSDHLPVLVEMEI